MISKIKQIKRRRSEKKMAKFRKFIGCEMMKSIVRTFEWIGLSENHE